MAADAIGDILAIDAGPSARPRNVMHCATITATSDAKYRRLRRSSTRRASRSGDRSGRADGHGHAGDEPAAQDVVLKRGAYDAPATRSRPACRRFSAAAEDAPAEPPWAGDVADRSRAIPLTSRVAVNRFWHQYFGVGLVKTLEDWGVQGEPPSHPELLDWLAAHS
jgi:hypothetical protein